MNEVAASLETCNCIDSGTAISAGAPTSVPKKLPRPDADDRERLAVEPNQPPDDAWVATELSLPVGVADHRDGARSRPGAVLRQKRAAENRLDAEQTGNSCPRPAGPRPLASPIRRRRR